jgi:hypothetical protein
MSGTNRRKAFKVTALFAALLVFPLVSATAHADGFSLGGVFRIGGAHFNLAFGEFGHGHPRGYYYRTVDPIAYGGYRCNSYCFHDRGYQYHHDSCPLVRHHLAYFDIDPLGLFTRYAPGYSYNYNYGYGYNHYYGNRTYNRHHDRRSGYNRYDRRYDNRYDRYDRYPYPDRRRGYDRDHRRHDRNDGRYDRGNRRDGRNDGRYDRDNRRNDRRNDGRHDRGNRRNDRNDRHQRGHSSSGARPQQH